MSLVWARTYGNPLPLSSLISGLERLSGTKYRDLDIRTPAVTIISSDQTIPITITRVGQVTDEVGMYRRIIDLSTTQKEDLEVEDLNRRYQLLGHRRLQINSDTERP